MGAWQKTIEPQKQGNSPGSGPEVVKSRGSPKSERHKESVAGQCRMRWEVSWDECPHALQEGFSMLPILEKQELNSRLCPLQQR